MPSQIGKISVSGWWRPLRVSMAVCSGMDSILSHLAGSVSSAQTLEELTRRGSSSFRRDGLESTYLTASTSMRRPAHPVRPQLQELEIPEGLTVRGMTPCASVRSKRAVPALKTSPASGAIPMPRVR